MLAKMSAHTNSPFTATTTPLRGDQRKLLRWCWRTPSPPSRPPNRPCGRLRSFCMTFAYEVVPDNSLAARGALYFETLRHLRSRFGHFRPHLLLIFVGHRLAPYRGRRHACTHHARNELSARASPASRFHAEHVEIDGVALGRHDAVFGDDAILLPARHDLSGEQQ